VIAAHLILMKPISTSKSYQHPHILCLDMRQAVDTRCGVKEHNAGGNGVTMRGVNRHKMRGKASQDMG